MLVPCVKILAHRVCYLNALLSRRHRYLSVDRGEALQCRRETGFCSKTQLAGYRAAGRVAQGGGYTRFAAVIVGVDADVRYVYLRTRFDVESACNAVPVCLRVVGQAVCVDADVDIFDAVVDPHAECMGACAKIPKVVTVRRAEGILHSEHFPVQPHGAFPMHPFHVEHQLLLLHILGYGECAFVPGRSDILFFGLQPENHLYVIRLAPFFVKRFAVPRRIGHPARPFRIYRNVVSLAVGGHGAGELHLFRKCFLVPFLRDADIGRIDGEIPVS